MSVQHVFALIEAYAMSTGRLGSLVAGLAGLTGIVIGGLALARPVGGRNRAVVALAAGLSAIVLGGLVAATSDGGVGTGNGFAGAFVALALGTIATVLGGLGLARARRGGASA